MLLLLFLVPSFICSSPLQDPELVVEEVQKSINASRRNLAFLSCGTGNPIDDCWRDGKIYVVTDPGDHPVNPKPGTLRYGVIQEEPLWIIFKRDMVIKLKQELMMNSFKTIDGRGANVHIAGGPCITIQFVTNIIIHGINIHDCKRGGNAYVRDSPTHYGFRTLSDAITISNNYLTHHNKVMLLGHSDSFTRDKNMQVTIAFNHFGEGLVQRMPRCRHGYFHVVNNDYINGKCHKEGECTTEPMEEVELEVFRRFDVKWCLFTASGAGASSSYARASSLAAKSSSLVSSITASAGSLNCRKGSRC
ncbi:Pectin lyase fold/virulence factor [Sesbania bispinosa]|nr:Pectin lyase fold/virulence factor [Sesbania bispinosa]